MFDLLEEYVSTQEQQGGESTEEKSAHTSQPRSAALFSMPEKFIPKEDNAKKKNHPLVPVLVVCILVLVGASIALAFAIQNKNTRIAEEKARQEATRISALQAIQKENAPQLPASEENTPFQINENLENSATSTDSIGLSVPTSSEPVVSSLVSSTSTGTVDSSAPSDAPPPSDITANQEVVTFGEDSDKDTLSDNEERMYKTDQKKPDSDLDGILDGAEIKNLYDPTKGEGALLKNSDLVSVFTNQTYHYTFFYPKFPDEWAVGVIDQSQKEVLVSAASGEYISVRIEDNPQKLKISDWYTTIYAAGKPTESVRNISFGEWNVLMREDGMVYYMVRKDVQSQTLTPSVYVLTYTSNTKKELHYFTTFQMLVKSFSPLEILVTIEQ